MSPLKTRLPNWEHSYINVRVYLQRLSNSKLTNVGSVDTWGTNDRHSTQNPKRQAEVKRIGEPLSKVTWLGLGMVAIGQSKNSSTNTNTSKVLSPDKLYGDRPIRVTL